MLPAHQSRPEGAVPLPGRAGAGAEHRGDSAPCVPGDPRPGDGVREFFCPVGDQAQGCRVPDGRGVRLVLLETACCGFCFLRCHRLRLPVTPRSEPLLAAPLLTVPAHAAPASPLHAQANDADPIRYAPSLGCRSMPLLASAFRDAPSPADPFLPHRANPRLTAPWPSSSGHANPRLPFRNVPCAATPGRAYPRLPRRRCPRPAASAAPCLSLTVLAPASPSKPRLPFRC